MNATNENLRQELLAMRAEDARVREELAATGELFNGYNSTMEAVHLKNARRLEELIEEHGWLGKSLVGEDGAEAAWIILQHAISRPDLQRRMLPVLKQASERGEVSATHAAYLEDRILSFEGKPQIYGTQFDWNERDMMSANEIFEPERIDERRAAIGLETPYSEIIKTHNEAVRKTNEKPPADLRERQREFEAWARRIGWRE
jgi:hypothetical protein